MAYQGSDAIHYKSSGYSEELADRDRVPYVPHTDAHTASLIHGGALDDLVLKHACEVLCRVTKTLELQDAISRLSRNNKVELAKFIEADVSMLNDKEPFLLKTLGEPMMNELFNGIRDRKPVKICMGKMDPVDSSPWLLQIDWIGGPLLTPSVATMIKGLHIIFDPMPIHTSNSIGLFQSSDPYLPGQGYPDEAFSKALLNILPDMPYLQQLNLELNLPMRKYNAVNNPSFAIWYPQWLARFTAAALVAAFAPHMQPLWIFARVADHSQKWERNRVLALNMPIETWINSYRNGTVWGLPWYGIMKPDELKSMQWPDIYNGIHGDAIFWREPTTKAVTER
ncbi:hypothetical protein E2P81_ATG07869 [Venturia nashicola]|nr:hypothetical protein E2P81_ATG07869 [Venturia nashicola]